MKLSVVISVGRDQSHLAKLLDSIKTQTLDASVHLEHNNLYPNRASGYRRAEGDLVLFLDADCELPNADYFSQLHALFERNPLLDVVGGNYLNPKNANSIARSYNQLCNFWTHIGEGQNLLGGVFCIRKASLKTWPVQANFWGGEDTLLFRELKTQGVKLEANTSISVIHHDHGSFLKLIRRAWIHGRARSERNLFTPLRHQKIWQLRRKLFREMNLTEMCIAFGHYLLVCVSGLLSRPKTSPHK